MLTTKPPENPDPITVSEVTAWFREVVKRGGIPNDRTCTIVADMLCNWQPGGWRHSEEMRQRWLHLPLPDREKAERKRWSTAANVIRSALLVRMVEVDKGTVAPVDMLLVMNDLDRSLTAAEGWFGWAPEASDRVPWHAVARVVLAYTQMALTGDKPRPVGISSPGGPAVKFAHKALTRLGFPEATCVAISELAPGKKAEANQSAGSNE